MDIYDSRYFNINKKLLMSTGLWPYQKRERKIILRVIVGIAITMMTVPHVIGLRMNYKTDIDRALEHAGVILFGAMMFMKMFSSALRESKLKIVYDDIAKNWQMLTDKWERDKLIEHSEKGRLLTIGYVVYCMGVLILFLIIPLIPVILNKVKPLNESRSNVFILDGEFIVDRDLYFSRIYVYDAVSSTITVLVLITVDTMFAACVQHCVGLFSIIQYRLKKPNNFIYNKCPGSENEEASCEWMIGIIRLHKQVITYIDSMETAYSLVFLVIISVTILYFSIVYVLVIVYSSDLLNLIRYIGLLFGILVHLFFLSWLGQQLIDHSAGLYNDAYLNEWYESPTRSRKLLRLFTLRCAKPCVLTAGGLYVMNLSNFLAVVKTSASYITVFSSMR